MNRVGCRMLGGVLAAAFLASCTSPTAVSWNDREPVFGPTKITGVTDGDVGYVLIETDTDIKATGNQTYYNIRRPYEIYSTNGKLIRYVQNQGARSGEEPAVVTIPPGRYVVTTEVGASYRWVQIEVHPGALTRVSEKELSEAPATSPST